MATNTNSLTIDVRELETATVNMIGASEGRSGVIECMLYVDVSCDKDTV